MLSGLNRAPRPRWRAAGRKGLAVKRLDTRSWGSIDGKQAALLPCHAPSSLPRAASPRQRCTSPAIKTGVSPALHRGAVKKTGHTMFCEAQALAASSRDRAKQATAVRRERGERAASAGSTGPNDSLHAGPGRVLPQFTATAQR